MLDKIKKPVTSTLRCRICGKIVSNYGHDCSGMFPVDKVIDIGFTASKITGVDRPPLYGLDTNK